MKAHKYWSLGALACMAGCFYTGCKKLMQAHKYFACGSLVWVPSSIMRKFIYKSGRTQSAQGRETCP